MYQQYDGLPSCSNNISMVPMVNTAITDISAQESSQQHYQLEDISRQPVAVVHTDTEVQDLAVKILQQLSGNLSEVNNVTSTSNNMQSSGEFQPAQVYVLPVQFTKEWHRNATPELRDHIANQLVQSLYPNPCSEDMHDRRMQNLIVYSKKIENDMYEMANSIEEYYTLMAEKIYNLQEQLKVKRQKRKQEKEMQAQQQQQPTGPNPITVSMVGNYVKSAVGNCAQCHNSTFCDVCKEKANQLLEAVKILINQQQEQRPLIDTSTGGETSSNTNGSVSLFINGNNGISNIQNSTTHEFGEVKASFVQEMKTWHQSVGMEIRNGIVQKLVQAIFPNLNLQAILDRRTHNAVLYARKVEANTYMKANSSSEYYDLMAQKIQTIRSELEIKLQQIRGPEQQPQQQYVAQESAVVRNVGEEVSRNPNTIIEATTSTSAVGTQTNGVGVPMVNQPAINSVATTTSSIEQELFDSLNENDQLANVSVNSNCQSPKGPWFRLEKVSATPAVDSKEWHQDFTLELRNHIVRKIVQAVFPNVNYYNNLFDKRMHNLVSYAQKVELDLYGMANSRSEYYNLLTQKMHSIVKEYDKERQRRNQNIARNIMIADRSMYNYSVGY